MEFRELDGRYEAIRVLGAGVYGEVFEALDVDTNERVAIKRMKMEGMSRSSQREIWSLARLKGEENIVELKEAGVFKADEEHHLCMVFEYLEGDLRSYQKSHRDEGGFLTASEGDIKCIMYHLLKGVAACHRRGIVHRDIKPENLLVDHVTGVVKVKVADFGLARGLDENPEMTPGMVTLWYRAPEILLGCPQYDMAVDVWSVGCIFGEMLLRSGRMFPGKNEIETLGLILEVCGSPDVSEWSEITSLKSFDFIRHSWNEGSKLSTIFSGMPGVSSDALELLEKMLALNPKERITAAEALLSRYFNPFNILEQQQCPSDEECINKQVVEDTEVSNSNRTNNGTPSTISSSAMSLVSSSAMSLDSELDGSCNEGNHIPLHMNGREGELTFAQSHENHNTNSDNEESNKLITYNEMFTQYEDDGEEDYSYSYSIEGFVRKPVIQEADVEDNVIEFMRSYEEAIEGDANCTLSSRIRTQSSTNEEVPSSKISISSFWCSTTTMSLDMEKFDAAVKVGNGSHANAIVKESGSTQNKASTMDQSQLGIASSIKSDINEVKRYPPGLGSVVHIPPTENNNGDIVVFSKLTCLNKFNRRHCEIRSLAQKVYYGNHDSKTSLASTISHQVCNGILTFVQSIHWLELELGLGVKEETILQLLLAAKYPLKSELMLITNTGEDHWLNTGDSLKHTKESNFNNLATERFTLPN